MSEQVLLGELKKRRGEVLEMLKLTNNDHRFGLVIAKIDEEIKRLEENRSSSLSEEWKQYFGA